MKNFPTLYKKNNKGSLQYWGVSVYEDPDHSTAYYIQTEYGQLDTNSPQITSDWIKEGKNKGKKNETSAYEQALKEAESRYNKQLKKGYVDSIEKAKAGELSELITGGIEPMLAHEYSKHGHKIKYPAFVQPKLDGIRCIAILKDGKCTLWSRSRKPIVSMLHIVKEIENTFKDQDIILDGELYHHKYRNDFEYLVSVVRQEKLSLYYNDIEYHIYDIVNNLPFSERNHKLWELIGSSYGYLKFVATAEIESEEEINRHFRLYKSFGYEGIMVRNAKSLYVNKRSYDLQKVKEFQDEEFEIIGAQEGKGKLMGHVGSFICKTKEGKEFLAKMSGNTDRLAEYFKDPSLYMGKMLTVQFQGYTSKEKVPRFPVGLRIREMI